MSKVWVGAWALESELAEAEERRRTEAEATATASLFSSSFPILFAGEPSQNFPSLQEATTKPQKKKTLPIKFTIGSVGHGGARRISALDSKGSGVDQMLNLPTGPRERTAEELDQSRFRGAFRCHGNDAAPSPRRSYFSLIDNSRPREDEKDSWVSEKRFTPTLDSGRQERARVSKADGVDNWSLGKKSTIPPPPPPNRRSGFGSGFRDSAVSGVDSGGESLSSNGELQKSRLLLDPPLTRPSPFGAARPREEVLAEKGLDWRKMETKIELKKGLSPTSSQYSMPPSRPGSSVSYFSGEGAAPSPRPPKVNPFGNAKPREVVLDEKGMDWKKVETEIELKKGLSPTSSLSSRPSSVQSSLPGSCVSHFSGEGAVPSPRPPKVNPFGNAKPRELVLEEKGMDWRNVETEIELKKGLSPTSCLSSRPPSVQSSRPGSSVSCFSGEGAAPSPRPPKVNPFGNAKPREVVLEEKGMDWRKIDLDLEHRGVDRPDTDEEKILKEEIDRLRDKFAKETERQIDCEYAPSSTEQISSLLVQIGQREKELTQLICELDDKVRFRKRASMKIRPGPDSGRIRSFSDGPPSQSGSSVDSKNTVFTERLPSREMNDKWSRSLDDRCGFQRRDSGFLASRSLDRPSKFSERW